MERAAPPSAAAKPVASAPQRPAAKPSGPAFGAIFAKLGLGRAAFTALAPAPPPPAAPPHLAARPVVHARSHDERRESHVESKDAPILEHEDPTWTHRAALVAPPPLDLQAQARGHVEGVARHASIEELAPQLLRKLAWSGDGRRGAARLELASGTVVTLEADGRDVSFAAFGLSASEESTLRARLAEGLSARGFRLVG